MNVSDGILLVDKPTGVTSFAVVNHIRRQLVQFFPELERKRRRSPGEPKPPRFKCGHAGTLDPLATGLLIVLVGKGSRLAPFLMGLDKTYAATVRFGTGTDTLDRLGEVVASQPVPASPEVVAECLADFRGEIQQVPPIFSALKKDGQTLYKLARSGQEVAEPEAREVTIHRLEMTDARWEGSADDIPHEVDLMVTCSSGTYIRSLARDLARAAGSEGHLHQLRRLTVGPFAVADGLSDVLEREGQGLAAALLPLSAALPHVPALILEEDEVAAVRQGQQPQVPWLEALDAEPPVAGKAGRLFRMLDGSGDLVAVGRLEEGTGLPRIAAVIAADQSTHSQR
jgi:tRNA pseudouridine55 synthase